jgi:hypothetical protein
MFVDRLIGLGSPAAALRRAIELIEQEKFAAAFPLLTRAAKAGIREASRGAISRVRACRPARRRVCAGLKSPLHTAGSKRKRCWPHLRARLGWEVQKAFARR